MRTLQQRGYIAEVGRDPGPGQAVMFGTTRAFLERLGVDSLTDLPALGDFVPGAEVVEQLERGLRPDGGAPPDVADLVDDDEPPQDGPPDLVDDDEPPQDGPPDDEPPAGGGRDRGDGYHEGDPTTGDGPDAGG
jgi:segregation and condensation protein B